MKTTKFALSLAFVLLTAGAAIAGDAVVRSGPYGQSGTVTFLKPSPQTTTVALYRDRQGVSNSASPEQTQSNFHSQTFGSFGNGAPVSFYSGSH